MVTVDAWVEASVKLLTSARVRLSTASYLIAFIAVGGQTCGTGSSLRQEKQLRNTRGQERYQARTKMQGQRGQARRGRRCQCYTVRAVTENCGEEGGSINGLVGIRGNVPSVGWPRQATTTGRQDSKCSGWPAAHSPARLVRVCRAVCRRRIASDYS